MRLPNREWDLISSAVPPLDAERVRIHRGDEPGPAAIMRRAVLALSGGRAVTLGNDVFLPDHSADDPATLAHELTHCAQFQRWGPLHYYARGLGVQLRDLLHRATGLGGSPYRYFIEPGKPFEAYGMEQQGQIVEDQVRFRCPVFYPPTAPSHSRRGRRSSP